MTYQIKINLDSVVIEMTNYADQPMDGFIVVSKMAYESINIGVSSYKNGVVNAIETSLPNALRMIWGEVRNRRYVIITKTDWTQMPDSPLTTAQKTAWATYRQALRDITTQADPDNITWPTPPGGI